MHIYYDYQIFSLQNVGGISRYFVELADKLGRRHSDIATTVLAPLHINGYLASSSVRRIGVKVPQFPGKRYLLTPLNRMISKRCLYKEQPDVLHETYYCRCSLFDCKTRLLTVYDMIHERYPELFTGVDLDIPALKAAAVDRADHIITISETTRRDLIEFLGVPSSKITVVPLASSFTAKDRVSGWVERPFLLYVGLRGGVKNFKTLLTAFARSRLLRAEFDLVCVGGGYFSVNEEKTICDLGLAGQVKQVQASDSDLATLYADAALFVYPSLYEGFGLPLLEAMRCGCVIACSNTSSMPEIAADAALYFDPLQEEEIRSVIEDGVSSTATLNSLRLKGYERQKQFSWRSCVDATAEVYRSVK